MNVLVSAASRHGATAEIAEAIGRTLAEAGHAVDVRPPADVTDLAGVDAVVLGSAVYAGSWLAPARELVDRLGAELATRPVWLFSSGPLGDPPMPAEEIDVSALVRATGARDHRVFPGALDKHKLPFAERAIVRGLRAPMGDFRDFAAVAEWARGIAAELGTG
ncbi:flavodoxin domain-containing protein [Georgenia sp. TF02-10]|uniref:flavodoxin domain-containing protein n=1 Tax=Georgenia sp. TF02-10 TaxID=2917725 RepID=UPI001FA787ED|nr:flavodoxin domain-containing protein [Georgenia sp. TF02-10]UNX53930.1 flavodoxin domain-containing protein [Georgenia sp. TF02-10]